MELVSNMGFLQIRMPSKMDDFAVTVLAVDT